MDSADHTRFQFAAERYILGELSEPDTLAFEEHFFSCVSCAQDVEDLTAIRVAASLVLPHLKAVDGRNQENSIWSWFGLHWIPQAALGALALLAVVTGYQNAVEIPRLKAAAGQEELKIATVEPLTGKRGAGATKISAAQRQAQLLVVNEWPQKYSHYRAQIASLGSDKELEQAETAGGEGFVQILIPASKLGPGNFELKIYGSNNESSPELVARHPFTIEEKNGK